MKNRYLLTNCQKKTTRKKNCYVRVVEGMLVVRISMFVLVKRVRKVLMRLRNPEESTNLLEVPIMLFFLV